MRKRVLVIGLAAVALDLADAAANQRSLVTSAAVDIRTFELNEQRVRRFMDVTRAMDRLPPRGPEAPRPDVAMFVVLSMSLSFNEPYTDRTVPDTVRTIQSGHSELADAIKQAGLSVRDYVLTQITLLLSYSAGGAERQGRALPLSAGDVAPATMAFVRSQWPLVEQAMQGVLIAAAANAR